MAFQISPGVNVSEVDLTTVVPSVLTTAGAFAGPFPWGPVEKIKQISNEIVLVQTFAPSGPDANTATSFFSAANFLAYGNNLQVVRAANTTSLNSTGATTVQIKNEDVYEASYLNNTNNNTYGSFAARYPGGLGNSIRVEVFDSANTTLFNSWSYKNYFSTVPGTSTAVTGAGGLNDEMHIVVIDAGGKFTGTANTVLETYPFVSKAGDATNNGSSNYYKQVIFNNSKYVYAMDPMDYAATSGTWGQASSTTFIRITTGNYPTGVFGVRLTGGTDVQTLPGNLQNAYALFTNKETTDISLVITGDADLATQQYVIDNIASARADCIAFVSPPSANVINQSGNETTNIVSWNNALSRSSASSGSYTVADSGWKYQYDRYNQTYRYIPLNADIAGLCVYTDTVKDPWFSPAGFNRGSIKNCIKLAWNPSKTQRDTIYAAGINPVVSFPGQGTVLFGDKTLQAKPSAFDRVNVRRLFIVLEKSISTAAKYSLFELNDEFTRAQFVSLVTPFLRDVQGRRGITDFKVVCDSTNNTSNVIDSNQFVGDIYIKPARSVNYIQLNFVAVATGVDFRTIVGSV
jgi:hypothetical protein